MKRRFSTGYLIPMFLMTFCISLPTLGQVVIEGESVHERYAKAGDSYSGSITLKNRSRRRQTAHLVRIQDFQTARIRQIAERRSAENRSNASWISFDRDVVTLHPGEVARIDYEVMVPHRFNGSTLAGTYWSTFAIFESDAKADALTIEPDGLRYIDLATHIRESGFVDVAISKVEVFENEDKDLFIRAEIDNTGESLLRPVTWFEIYDPAGNLIEKLQGQSSRIYPGSSSYQYVSVDHMEPGQYEVLVVVDAGEDHIYGAQHSVEWAGYGHYAQTGQVDTRQ